MTQNLSFTVSAQCRGARDESDEKMNVEGAPQYVLSNADTKCEPCKSSLRDVSRANLLSALLAPIVSHGSIPGVA